MCFIKTAKLLDRRKYPRVNTNPWKRFVCKGGLSAFLKEKEGVAQGLATKPDDPGSIPQYL